MWIYDSYICRYVVGNYATTQSTYIYLHKHHIRAYIQVHTYICIYVFIHTYLYSSEHMHIYVKRKKCFQFSALLTVHKFIYPHDHLTQPTKRQLLVAEASDVGRIHTRTYFKFLPAEIVRSTNFYAFYSVERFCCCSNSTFNFIRDVTHRNRQCHVQDSLKFARRCARSRTYIYMHACNYVHTYICKCNKYVYSS